MKTKKQKATDKKRRNRIEAIELEQMALVRKQLAVQDYVDAILNHDHKFEPENLASFLRYYFEIQDELEMGYERINRLLGND